MPLVTIIIPAFNVNEYITRCLDSILEQTYSYFEILVIDDGSSDNTLALVQTYGLKISCIKVISKKNGGCASARMAGLRESRGQYVCFVDADDWIGPTFLAELLSACIATNIPIASCFYESCFEADKSQSSAYPHSFLKGPFRKLGFETIPAIETLLWKPTIWASLFEREFLLRNCIEFPEHIRMFDDLAFHAEIAFSGANVAIVPKHLYNYRLQRPGQDVSNRAEKLFVHFDIFDYLETKLSQEAKRSVDYFLLKYQSHRWTLGIIEKQFKDAYRSRAAVDLFRHLGAREAIGVISELSKIKRRYGRDALLLLTNYQLKNRGKGGNLAKWM